MNLKKSLRVIFRNKTYSLLNIAGLAIGITAATLIFLWVESKVNFNRNIPNHPNIYIAGYHYKNAKGEYNSGLLASSPYAEALKNDFPEIKRTARYSWTDAVLVPENTTDAFEEEGTFADLSVFEMIGAEFIYGNLSSIPDLSRAIILSERLATKVYGADNPLGKGILIDGEVYEVGGVFKDLPKNTIFQFDWLISMDVYEQIMKKTYSISEWGTSWMRVYVEVEPHTDINQLNAKLEGLALQKAGETYRSTSNFIYPIDRTLLYGEFKDGKESGEGYVKMVRLFIWIGIPILLLACINFMNLSTARAQKRAMEVGLRKTFGTRRKYLVKQFLIEAGLITLLALLLSIVCVLLCLPSFNQLIDGDLSFDWTNPYIVGGFIGIGVFCCLAAGGYPAFYLSSFNPIATLKMQKTSGRGSAKWIREALVVFQFAVAYILICTTTTLFLQIDLGKNRELGMEKEHILSFEITKEVRDSYTSVQSELRNSGVVESSGFSSSNLLYANLTASPWFWQGKAPDDDVSVAMFFYSEGLFETAGMKVLDGGGLQTEGREGMFINETLAKRMGDEGRVGGEIGQTTEKTYTVLGILKNHVFGNPYALQPEPAAFIYRPQDATTLFVRLKPGVNTLQAVETIQSVLKGFTSDYLFTPTFMTDTYNQMFKEDLLVQKLSALFAGLAIFISCLGLFGLSAFSAEQRTKEIGIRKVLGATISDVLGLLGKSYLKLLLISFVIAIPVSVYLVHQYLKDYAYRISLGWELFAGVALFVALIALLTVSSLSLKAAMANPVKSIKTE